MWLVKGPVMAVSKTSRGSDRRGRGKTTTPPRPSRATRRSERRDAILMAALQEFSGRGFAATRLDDIAHSAGVAKGTIYLYFRHKESLFQELIRSQLNPVVSNLEAAMIHDLPLRVVAEQIVDVFVREIYGTPRKDIIRLIISEGPRFPEVAEFYYREVLSRVIEAVRGLLQRAVQRGELQAEAVVRFPQLLAAPGIVAIIWNSLFERLEPLDVRAFMTAHLDLLFGKGSRR